MNPNKIYKILLESDSLKRTINDSSDLNFNASALPKLISEALKFENFCLRNYKPIIKKLKDEGLINDNYSNLVDNINFSESEKTSFSYPHYYKKTFFKDNSPPTTKSPDGYFSVWFKSDFKYDIVIKDILENYKSRITNKFEWSSKNVIYVSASEIVRFLNEYSNCEGIHFSDICKETSILWSNELINKYKNIWDWKYIHSNPSIKINFKLIEFNYDKVDWSIISGHNALTWNIEYLEKWKDYLIFSMCDKHENQHQINVLNKKGQSFDKSYLSNSISNSSSVKWDKNILEKLKDYFDWYELSKNESIGWDIELLQEFSDKVDFKVLSTNKSVKWSEELIEKFKEQLDWNKLSGNPSLPWSYEFLKRYEAFFSWIPEFYSVKHEECINEPSISGNKGINWSEKLIDTFKEKLDFWIIARVGNIDTEITRKYKSEFDRKEHVGFVFHKRSDWRETENIFVNGWQNLTKNSNFYLDKNLMSFYFANTISISYSIGNLAGPDGQVFTNDVKLLEILKEKETNVTRQDLVDAEFGWTQVLLNEHFINETIWVKLIKPFITDFGIDLFLDKLKNTVPNNVYKK